MLEESRSGLLVDREPCDKAEELCDVRCEAIKLLDLWSGPGLWNAVGSATLFAEDSDLEGDEYTESGKTDGRDGEASMLAMELWEG